MNTKQIFILIIILFIHYFILNPLLKNIVEQYFITSRRPDSKNTDSSFETLGMPSGHAETITILSIILYYYKFINLKICILLIFITGMQRIITKRHSFEQVIMGILFGILYSYIYINTNLSFISVTICLFLIILYLIILENKLTSKMQNIPKYINKQLYPYIIKKRNKSYDHKLLEIFSIIFSPQKTLFFDYSRIEKDLNKYIEKNKDILLSIDYIVGIKTGGAILGNYLSQKLNKPIYFIKSQHKKYNCKFDNKNDINIFRYILFWAVEYHIDNNYKDYEMCEKINDDIENKTVLLIDESIGSGNTINKCIEYLYQEKKVKYVMPVIFMKNNKINYVSENAPLIWSWGYDN